MRKLKRLTQLKPESAPKKQPSKKGTKTCWNCETETEVRAFGPKPHTWACVPCSFRTFTDFEGGVHVIPEGKCPLWRNGKLKGVVTHTEHVQEQNRYNMVLAVSRAEKESKERQDD